MPLKDMILLHFDANERTQILDLVAQIRAILDPKLVSLLPEERQRYGSVGEENKKFINKVRDLIEEDPINVPSEVDWIEFGLDFQDRKFLETLRSIFNSLGTEIDSTKIMHDFDNYHAGLAYYEFQVYRSNVGAINAQEKVKQLRAFFNRTGANKKKDGEEETDTPDTTPTDTKL